MTMTMAGGWGGDPEPGTYICICIVLFDMSLGKIP